MSGTSQRNLLFVDDAGPASIQPRYHIQSITMLDLAEDETARPRGASDPDNQRRSLPAVTAAWPAEIHPREDPAATPTGSRAPTATKTLCTTASLAPRR